MKDLIPVESLSQHVAIVGKTGSGKTVAAKGQVERLLDAGKRVAILDPTGAWWGLKHSADGETPGYPIVVFGGDHADVPITEFAGAALGKLVAETNTPCIIDLSALKSTAARHRFALAFFESVYELNKSPLHLIVDEADEFAPQSGAPGTEKMLGAFDRIIRRGRIKGFRVWMITQRPAVLNKNALTQANTLIAMRLPSSQDRKAIELWVKGQGDEEQSDKMMRTLAGQQRGQGWVWAPEVNVLHQVQFPLMKTFDSSKTPEEGETLMRPTNPADVDLTGIRAAMAEAIELAEKDDPKALREKIDKLTKDLAAARQRETAAMNAPVPDLDRRIQNAEDKVHSALLYFEHLVGTSRKTLNTLKLETAVLEKGILEAEAALADFADCGARKTTTLAREPAPAANRGGGAGPSVFMLNEAHTSVVRKDDYEQGLLDALAWLEGSGASPCLRESVAALAGRSSSSSTFEKKVANLIRAGLITGSNGHLAITNEGRARAKKVATKVTDIDLQRSWLQAPGFDDYDRSLIEAALWQDGPTTREKLGKLANRSTTSSTFEKKVSSLIKLGVLAVAGKGLIQAGPSLFLRGGGRSA